MAAILERDLGDSGAGMSECTERNGQLLGGGHNRRGPFTRGYMRISEFWIVFLGFVLRCFVFLCFSVLFFALVIFVHYVCVLVYSSFAFGPFELISLSPLTLSTGLALLRHVMLMIYKRQLFCVDAILLVMCCVHSTVEIIRTTQGNTE